MNLPYCTQQVFDSDKDRFLQGLFIPSSMRESLMVIYALNVELMHVRQQVREEMIGHIRYAWWQERIEALYEGKQTQGHPVLEPLFSLVQEGYLPQQELLALVEEYRSHYPEFPVHIDQHLEQLSQTLLKHIYPQGEALWRRAHTLIQGHRQKYGQKHNGWLALKLLLAGTGLRNRANTAGQAPADEARR